MAECSIDFDGATNAHAAETTINIQKIDLALFITARGVFTLRRQRQVRFRQWRPLFA